MDSSKATLEEQSPEESLKPEALEETEQEQQNKFGTFGGVFTPTVLTILGVILFLRVGWVVGNAGLLGSILIITVGFLISTCTALAMSSITTNIRIGAGGAYAVIAQSLGLEVGGAVGIPRYLSQALAVTMYIFGFRAGWMYLFPDHPPLLVDICVFILLYGIAYISADFAIKTQYLIMAIIAGSLVSITMAAATGSMEYSITEVPLWGDFVGSPDNDFQGTTFWVVFAVFFPATTGIMAGANMSGDLKEPKRSIPSGTLWAIGVSFVIYVLLAIWLSLSASPTELTHNYTVAMDEAYWPKLVLAGLLGATFSSALASLVGAARILQAMGEHHIVPGDDWLAELSDNAEPRHAMMVTGGLILLSILLRDLNAIAPLITMFFLVTYAMICAAVVIEQGLDMVSFRPTLRVPIWVSMLGLAGSLIAMFIINPTVSLISLAVTVGFYVFLAQRHLEAPFEDVRSGLFRAFAEWSAQKVRELPPAEERAWKPNLLVPLDLDRNLPGSFEFLRDLTYPKGSLKFAGFTHDWSKASREDELNSLAERYRSEGIFTRTALIERESFLDSVILSLILSGGFFGPNILCMDLPEDSSRDEDYSEILNKARYFSMGMYLIGTPEGWSEWSGGGINVWVSDMSPSWDPKDLPVSLDLALLTGYVLKRNWDAQMNLVCGIEDEKNMEVGRRFLENYRKQARFPGSNIHLIPGDFNEALEDAPDVELEIVGFPEDFDDFDFMRGMVEKTGRPCLFVKGTGHENALA
ncbi:MAG: Na-K-Cl cotransporter [bacterium]